MGCDHQEACLGLIQIFATFDMIMIFHSFPMGPFMLTLTHCLRVRAVYRSHKRIDQFGIYIFYNRMM